MNIATKNTVSHHHLEVNVPNHWQVVPLENILTGIVGGGTPSRSKDYYWEGSIPWLTVKDMRTRRPIDAIDHISEKAVLESATNIIPPDTIIIATRVGLGKIIRVPFEAAINQDLKALITKPEVDKSYLEYWFMCIADYLGSIGSGTTVKGIRLEQLRSLPVPLAPLNDQKRIVAEIEKQFSRLDEAVTSLKRAKANLKRYKAAVLKAAVEGKLTEAWRKQHPDVEPASELLKRILAERRRKWEEAELAKMRAKGTEPKNEKWRKKYKEPNKPTTDAPIQLPEGWCWLTIDSIAFVTKLAGFEYTKYVNYDDAGDLAVIKAENAGRNGFKRTEFSKVRSETIAHLTRSSVKAGDLLMVFVGAGTGNVAQVPDDQPYFLGPNIAMLRINSPYVLPQYLEHYLRSPNGRMLILGFIKAVAQPSLSMGTIRMIPVALPSISEQTSIVGYIESLTSVMNEAGRVVEKSSLRTERLRQSILHKAFSGNFC